MFHVELKGELVGETAYLTRRPDNKLIPIKQRVLKYGV